MARSYLLPATVGSDLKALREQSSLNQKQLERESGLEQSKVSRIEKGETTPSDVDVNTYLGAIKPALAKKYKEYLRSEWSHFSQPSFFHPDREALSKAEMCLKAIEGAFPDEEDASPIRGQLRMYRDALLRHGKFLEARDHTLALLGPIGVGKSTAISHLTGLVVPSKSQMMERCVLEVAGGRTTLCEVALSRAEGQRPGIVIEAQSDEEVHALVGDMCAGLVGTDSVDDEHPRGVPTEIETALRNMAGVARKSVIGAGKKRVTTDPIKEMAGEVRSRVDLQAEVCSRMNLPRRTRTTLWFDGAPGKELEWLKRTFSDVNRGRIPDVPFPRRISVLMPDRVLDLPFDVTVVDTKGIENAQMVIRPDLLGHLTDPRTLSILCTSFENAPDAISQQIISHMEDVGETSALRCRVAILALPKHDQALQVTDDGAQVNSKEHGYEVRERDAADNLRRQGHDVPPFFFFNAAEDEPKNLVDGLAVQIRRLRDTYVAQIDTIDQNVRLLLADEEYARIAVAQAHVLDQLRIFCDRHASLPKRARPAHDDVIKAMRAVVHPTVLWASTRRRGRYSAFNLYFRLGSAGAADAQHRSAALFAGLEEQLGQWRADPSLEGASGLLESVGSNLEFWRGRFIEVCRRAAEETFRSALVDPSVTADSLWRTTESFFGAGHGYREKVAEAFETWFDDDDREELHNSLERRMREAWRTEVIEQLYGLFAPTTSDNRNAA